MMVRQFRFEEYVEGGTGLATKVAAKNDAKLSYAGPNRYGDQWATLSGSYVLTRPCWQMRPAALLRWRKSCDDDRTRAAEINVRG